MQQLWSSKKYAAATGRSERTVERERERGDGCAYVRFGKRIFYRPEDVENYIAAHVCVGGGVRPCAATRRQPAENADANPQPDRRGPPRKKSAAAGVGAS
jgi:hypothetical protein